MKKIANRDGSQYTSELKEFKGSNTYAEDLGNVYVVYSYGKHFPMFIYDKLNYIWIENSDKYSVSTSKHMGQLRPYYHRHYENAAVLYKNTQEIKNIIWEVIKK